VINWRRWLALSKNEQIKELGRELSALIILDAQVTGIAKEHAVRLYELITGDDWSEVLNDGENEGDYASLLAE